MKKKGVREIIGRVVTSFNGFWSRFRGTKSVDKTVPDYKFWDTLRRGKAEGFKFGGLFAQPIILIISYMVLGDGVQATLAESGDPENENDPRTYTDGLLKRFMSRIHALLLLMVQDLYALGNQFLVVNPDGSISIPSPDTVDIEHDPLDFRKITKYIITTVLERATVTDEYMAEKRVVTIKWAMEGRTGQVDVVEFDNLIGRIPIVHFANERGTNETHGRPLYEPLYHLFARYDDLIEKALDGAELMGNPIPTFQGMDNVAETIEANSEETEETYITEAGDTRSRPRIAIDQLAAVIIGKGGEFKMVSAAIGFTEDIKGMLKVLFLLMLEYTRIPEAVWGGELGQARASASEQMKSFYQYIQGRRTALEGEGSDDLLQSEAKGGLLELIDIWLRTRKLLDPKIVVEPVTLRWTELSEGNEELRMKWVQWAQQTGLITDETALAQAELVEDPKQEIEKAREENKAKQDEFERGVDEELKRAQNQDDEEEDEELPEAA